MTDQSFWERKIVAFLHDPPDKLLLGFRAHEHRAEILIEQVLGRRRDQQERELAEKADSVAAAMDRGAFPQEVVITARDASLPASGAVLYWASPEVRHPLSGRRFEHLPASSLDERRRVSDEYRGALERIARRFAGDPRRTYLALWRQLPEAVPPVWRLIPADTRMVDHSLWDHLDATAAVVGALDRPALLVFALGPVQRYINQARRTQDLWMGSYILSYLTWEAARAIAETLGRDAILYPSLRGQPLVDRWLASPDVGVVDDVPHRRLMGVAAIPNRFVALVPADRAESLGKDVVVPAVRAAWERIACAVLWHLESLVSVDDAFREMWAAQTGVRAGEARDGPWELYWSYHAWPATRPRGDPEVWREAEAAVDEYARLVFPPGPGGAPDVPPDWHFGAVYRAHRQVSGGRLVNVGTAYSLLYALAERGLGARKVLRDFDQAAEHGEKCTVCGERAALHGRDGSRAGVRRFWAALANQLKAEGRHAEVKPDGRERLCAVCAVKRFAQRAFFEPQLGLRGGFPSTSTIASASFREQLMQLLKSRPLTDDVWDPVLAFHQELVRARSRGGEAIPRPVRSEAVPRLAALLREFPEGKAREVMGDLLEYDGDLFYPATYSVDSFRDSYGLDFLPEDVGSLRRGLERLLRRASLAGVAGPCAYFSVLVMDGDEIGAWLSGVRLPAFREALNSQAVDLFRRQWARGRLLDWQPLVDGGSRRLLGPASHAAISHALSNFALYCVTPVVEDLYPGRVVYAGGDDLLALLPADCALAAARDLRALYSGQATVDVGADGRWLRVIPEPGGHRSGFLRVGGSWLLAMGPAATISAGIAIAHHRAPLDAVLREAREALRSAKEAYGRDAVCVHVLKRSGDALRVGSRWSYGDLDAVSVFLGVRQRFREGRLSARLVYDLVAESRALAGVPGALEAELARLIKRHMGEAAKDRAEEEAKLLAAELARWSEALDGHRQRWEAGGGTRERDPVDEDYAPQPGCVELAKWMQLAQFLERGAAE